MNRKGTSDLFDTVASIENLSKAADKALENTDHLSKSMKEFLDHREERLKQLHDLLISGKYKTSKYYKFVVKEPKEREISALPFFPDRIVHHACMSVLLPIWMKKFTADTYNCLRGRGTHGFVKAIKRTLAEDVDGTKYCMQLDIRHFYPSISHEHLKRIFRWTIKDKRFLELLDEIIDSDPEGVPIGNYLSQFFATLVLTPFDHYVKETVGAKYYFRYCDDMIFFSDSKEELWRIFHLVRAYIEGLEMTIKPNYRVFPTDTGVDVVGYVFYHGHTRWRKRTKLRFEKKCKKAREKGLTGRKFKIKIGAYLGLMKYADTYQLRKKWLGNEFNLCKRKMIDFSDIAEGKDRQESCKGNKVSIQNILDQKVELHEYRHVSVHGKDKIIVQIMRDGEWEYFFTGSGVIIDKLERYSEHLPFCATVVKERNKSNNEYYTFK